MIFLLRRPKGLTNNCDKSNRSSENDIQLFYFFLCRKKVRAESWEGMQNFFSFLQNFFFGPIILHFFSCSLSLERATFKNCKTHNYTRVENMGAHTHTPHGRFTCGILFINGKRLFLDFWNLTWLINLHQGCTKRAYF
jgi:hypothetical protein